MPAIGKRVERGSADPIQFIAAARACAASPSSPVHRRMDLGALQGDLRLIALSRGLGRRWRAAPSAMRRGRQDLQLFGSERRVVQIDRHGLAPICRPRRRRGQGLADTGYIEGKNVAIEYRWAQGRNDMLPTLVAELVRLQVSVIVVLESTNGALAAKAATQTIPIVFTQGADPVQVGLVDSLNRPGGNLTGIGLLAAETAGKCLELLLELVPKAKSIGYLRNPTNPVFAESETRELEAAAYAHGVHLLIVNASRPSEIETAFADLVQQRVDALQVSSDGFLLAHPDQNRHARGPQCSADDLRLAPVHGCRWTNELWNEHS